MHLPIPVVYKVLQTKGETAAALRALLSQLSPTKVLLLTGRNSFQSLGQYLHDVIGEWFKVHLVVTDARCMEGLVESQVAPTAIVGVGGGRTLDLAKRLGMVLGIPVLLVPTLLSHDGLCSPVSVLQNGSGRTVSLPSAMPAAVLVCCDVLLEAPALYMLAGLGDLVANISAVKDWELAAIRGKDEINDLAKALSEAAARQTLVLLQSDGRLLRWTRHNLVVLANGLMLSGLSMALAGSSRPASGAEHLVSHSLNNVGANKLPHGAQVAYGTLLVEYLRLELGHNNDFAFLADTCARLGLPVSCGDLGYSVHTVAAALRNAPATRPGRYTILDEVELSLSFTEEIVSKLEEAVACKRSSLLQDGDSG